MKKNGNILKTIMILAVIAGCCILYARVARTHCDTMSGPVIQEAQIALEKGDVTPVMKWVKKEYEAELQTAFAKTVVVRAIGPEAKELADRYFLETFVRLHRAGEGAPYNGIKNEPVEPIVAMADRSLTDGSVDEMIMKISEHMAEAIKEKFHKVMEAKENKDKSVEEGREYVESYVTYMHYIEGIHTAITSNEIHHAGNGEGTAVHKE